MGPCTWVWPQHPLNRHPPTRTCSNLFNLVPHNPGLYPNQTCSNLFTVALTFGKRAIDIRLKCLLVCLVICLWRANAKLTRNFVAWEEALKATDNTRNDLSIFLFIKQPIVPKQTRGSLCKGKTPTVSFCFDNFYFNFIHQYAYHCWLTLHIEPRYESTLCLNASSIFLLKIIL